MNIELLKKLTAWIAMLNSDSFIGTDANIVRNEMIDYLYFIVREEEKT